jgi:hypothetical protein
VFVIYGVDEMSEDFGGATHLALLTRDEALDLEFRDFVREDEDTPARFEDRLVVVDGFTDLARRRGVTAAEYLGRELIGNFLVGQPRPLLPLPAPARGGLCGKRAGGGHLRALVREREWAVDVVQDLSGPLGVVLTKGVADDPEKAKAQALEAAYRVLRAL